MTTEQLVKAVIRAAPPPPPSSTDHDKMAFVLNATFAAAGYVLLSTAEMGDKMYKFVYLNPEKGSEKVRVTAFALNEALIVDVLEESSSRDGCLELNTAEFMQIGGRTYASHFKNLEQLVEKINKEILEILDDTAPDAGLLNQPSRLSMGFDDPDSYSTQNNGTLVPSYPGYVVPPIYNSGGGSDLFPRPEARIYPSRTNGQPGDMLIGPNDLLFLGHRIREPSMRGGPADGAPRYRFDPYGPLNVPGAEPVYFNMYNGPPNVPGFEQDYFGRRNPPSTGGGMRPDMGPFYRGSLF